jgi:DNA helicase-2/ATP-dependent DNA helicase PcrA
VQYLMVDEFQDTNHAQLRLVHALAGDGGNLTAVGDEDQGIYRWRGADLDNILEFERSFPEATVRKLERNYRSTQTILDASGALVAHNEGRRGKNLWTDGETGEAIDLYRASDEGDEARWLVNTLQGLRGRHALGAMAILVRTNAQTRALEEELMRQGVAYELVGGVRFYDRAEIKDVIAYLRVLRNPLDDFSLRRILNQPPRGIGKTTQDMLEARARELGQPVWDVLNLDDLGSFPARSAKALKAFRDLIQTLQRLAETLPLPVFLEQLLEATQYLDLYSPDDPEGQGRRENVKELVSAAQQFTETYRLRPETAETDDTVTAFLDQVALVSDIDGWQGREGVSVMTLHSAKGLEFPVVAIGGLEDGLLPHYNARNTDLELEEERRLLYVGMTRARERLILSTCQRRRVAGKYQDQDESPFVAEIPERFLNISESPSLFRRRAAANDSVYSFFGRKTPASHPQRDPSVEPVFDDSAGGAMVRGTRVRHSTLGPGQVLEVDGQGDSMKVVVYFDKVGKRKLVAKYAHLQVV